MLVFVNDLILICGFTFKVESMPDEHSMFFASNNDGEEFEFSTDDVEGVM